MRIVLHFIALLFEAIGATLAFFESMRLGETVVQLGFMDYDGPPKEFSAWYYHAGTLGFSLILLGIIAAGTALFLEHLAISRSHKQVLQHATQVMPTQESSESHDAAQPKSSS